MKMIDLKNTTTKIKNLLGGLNSRVEMTEDRISELEGRSIGFTQSEQQRENGIKKPN